MRLPKAKEGAQLSHSGELVFAEDHQPVRVSSATAETLQDMSSGIRKPGAFVLESLCDAVPLGSRKLLWWYFERS